QDHESHRGVFWAWVRYAPRAAGVAPPPVVTGGPAPPVIGGGMPVPEPPGALGDWWNATTVRLEPGPVQFSDGPLLTRFTAQHTWTYQPPPAQAGSPAPAMPFL